MKPKNIQRGIGSGQAGQRSAGDAPSLGKLARLHTVGSPAEARRRRIDQTLGRGEDRQLRVDTKNRRILLAGSLLLAGVTALVLGGFLYWWFLLRMPAEEGGLVAKDQIKVQAPPELVVPTEAEALALVKKALAVRDVAQVPTFFRLGSATPQAVVDFLEAETVPTAAEGGTSSFTWMGTIQTGGMALEGVLFITRGAGPPRNRLAMLTPDAAGKWQVDFDAFAETATPSWHELEENNAPAAQVRVFAVPDNYYNGLFRDEKEWVCYMIARPFVDTRLMAYAKIGSPQAAAMAELNAKPDRVFRVTLEIRRVAEAESRQFEISRVLAQDWVTEPVPFDEISR